MTQSTFVRDIKVKATTSTAVESYAGPKEEIILNVSLSPKVIQQENCETAPAKAPGGGIVEIAYANAPGESSKLINIIYHL